MSAVEMNPLYKIETIQRDVSMVICNQCGFCLWNSCTDDSL